MKTNESTSKSKNDDDSKQLNLLQNTVKKITTSSTTTTTMTNYSTPTPHSSSSSSSSYYNTIQSNGGISGNQHRKLMSSSSSTSSLLNNELLLNNNNNNNYHMPMNPFEETNKFRLEQSVLSPNLFHVANTSTPERDTNSLWNIDQRAVLYPADIPTDESSLIAQFIYDNKHNKQVSAAVEAFWTQNKIIIESPMGSSAGSSVLRSKLNAVNSASSNKLSHGGGGGKQPKTSSSLGVNSPLSYDLKNNFNQIYQMSRMQSTSSVGSASGSLGGGGTVNQNSSNLIMSSSNSSNRKNAAKRDQVCQTMLTFPTNIDLTKIPELKQFLIGHHENDTESPSKKELNNSIRKKLFDLNSDELSSSTITTSNTNSHLAFASKQKFQLDPVPKFKNSSLNHNNNNNNNNNRNSIYKLPKPDIMSSASESISVGASGVDTAVNAVNNINKLKTLASSSDSNDDCGGWRDSFDFDDDDHQFASSPKFDKYSNVLHDIGGDVTAPGEDLNDSVFLAAKNHQRTPPDVSPLFGNNNNKCVSMSHSHGGSTLLPASSLLFTNKKSNLDSHNSSVELYSDDDFRQMQQKSSSTKTSLHKNRYFCFEEHASIIHNNKENDSGGGVSFNANSLAVKSGSKKKSEKIITSPNLSPIRQDELVKEEKSKSHPSSTNKSSKKREHKNNVNEQEGEDANMSTVDSVPAAVMASNNSRSIIFMETCVNKLEKDENDNGQNLSFSESIINHEHHGHYPREEFYTKKLFHESVQQEIDAEINDTYRNSTSNQAQNIKKNNNLLNKSSSNGMHDEKQNSFLMPISSADVSRANSSIVTKQSSSINTTTNTMVQKEKGMNSSATIAQSLNSSKPPIGFTTMNSLINETTTNTFNQDSGYQTTSYQTTSMANCGANGSSSSSSSSCTHPSLINLDTTHAFKSNSNQQLNPYSSVNSKAFSLVAQQSNTNNILGSLIRTAKTNAASGMSNGLSTMANPATTITSTPMSLGDEDFNFNFDNVASSNFETHNNYLDFYDDDLNNKKEPLNYKTKKFDFSTASVKAPLLENKAHGATTTSSLSFEFNSKSNQNGILFGQSLPTDTKSLTTTSNKGNLLDDVTNTNSYKRPLSFDKKKNVIQKNSCDNQMETKTKKTSISLNSLQNIQPVESSTPEKLKSSFRTHFKGNSKKVFSKSTSISPPQNRQTSNITTSYPAASFKLLKGTLLNDINTNNNERNLKQKNSSLTYAKSKINFCSKSSDSLTTKASQSEDPKSHNNKNQEDDDDAYMSFNNSTCSNSNNKQQQQQQQNQQFYESKIFKSNSNNILKSNNYVNILNNQKQNSSIAISCNDLLAKKYELDSSYMDQSILMNKMSPSEYARNVLEKAKHDLNDSIKYRFSENILNTSNDTNTNRQLDNSNKIT